MAVLENPVVRSLLVVEVLTPVIEWHRRGLVPLGERLFGDARCRMVSGDFFTLADSEAGFDFEQHGRRSGYTLVPEKQIDSTITAAWPELAEWRG